jgi:hypothetical protein
MDRISAQVAATIALLIAAGMAGLMGGGVAIAATARATPTELWSCTNKAVYKPGSFTITCADGYTLLTKTHWTAWSATSATGTTDFGMNLCNPYCAASKISYFTKSVVHLSLPKATRHGKLFSKLTVDYVLKGKHKTFTFSWKGDPSFKTT